MISADHRMLSNRILPLATWVRPVAQVYSAGQFWCDTPHTVGSPVAASRWIGNVVGSSVRIASSGHVAFEGVAARTAPGRPSVTRTATAARP